jgi:PAS domain-containing protein
VQLSFIILTKEIAKFATINDCLNHTKIQTKKFVCVPTIDKLIEEYKIQKPDIVFFDAALDPFYFEDVQLLNPTIPIIIIANNHELGAAFLYLEKGAADFFLYYEQNNVILEKSIRLAIKEKATKNLLVNLNLRFELVSKATNEMIWDWDLMNNKVYRSQEGWAKIVGSNSLIDSNDPDAWRDRIHLSDIEYCDQIIMNILSDKNADVFELEYRVMKDDGSYAAILDRCYALRNTIGEIIRLTGSAKNISKNEK